MKIENRLLELKALKTITSAKTQKEVGTLFSGINLDSFYWDETREAYSRTITLLKQSGEMPTWDDLVTDPKLSEETRTSLRRYKKPKSNAPSKLAKRLSEYRTLRSIHEMCKGGLEALNSGSVDVERLVKTLVEQSQALSSGNSRKDWMVNIGGDDDTAMTAAKKALDPDSVLYIPTGLAAFDNENQGMPLGTLMILAGQTGGGKSILAGQIAKNTALSGFNTCVVPLEMSNIEMVQRELARSSEEDMTSVLNTKNMSKAKRKKLLENFEALHKKLKRKKSLLTYYSPEEDLTVEEILYGLQPYDYDVIIIDYVGLLAGVNGDDQWNALRKVTRFCKLYAQHHQKVIILAAQLSEEGQLRYARGMKEDANLMWTWRITPEVKETGIIQVIQEKARNQKDMPFLLKILWNTMTVKDIDEGDIKQQGKKKKKKKRDNYLDDDDDEDTL